MSTSGDYIVIGMDGVTILRVEVQSLMAMQDVQRLQKELDTLLDEGCRKLVIDLGQVQFAGSAALGVLMGIRKRMDSAGGKVVLAHTKHLDPLLKVTRANTIFKIAPNTDKAMDLIKA